MKKYPTISKKVNEKIEIVAFDKLDGSNIRVEWNNKVGFHKFGTKTRLLGEDQGVLFKSKDLFLTKYGDGLDAIFREKSYKDVTCFFEFFGPKSEFGQHQDNDDHDVVLFDVNPYKKGFVAPNDFIETYGRLGVPAVLYRGIATEEFVTSVKDGCLDGVTYEGVVCKGVRSRQIMMFKIKTSGWLISLKEHCGGNKKMFERLA